MINIDDYIQTAYDAMKAIVDDVYLDRPASVAKSINMYAVVECGNYVSNREISDTGEYNDYVTTINIDLFVRDRQSSKATNQRNIKKIADLIRYVQKLFPIVNKDKGIMIYKPRLILSSSDGDGWHYAIITAKLTTSI